MNQYSKIQITRKRRDGYPGTIIYADVMIDGKPLTDFPQFRKLDFVSCLGWGPVPYQEEQIRRLLLQTGSDFPNQRNSLYVCPCADLGCGAISVKIERYGDMVIWSDLGIQDDLGFRSLITLYKKIGPFYFDWAEYEQAIQGALLQGAPNYWHSSKWA